MITSHSFAQEPTQSAKSGGETFVLGVNLSSTYNAGIYPQPRAEDAGRSRRFLLLLAFFLAFSRTKPIAANARNVTNASHNTSRTTSKTRSP